MSHDAHHLFLLSSRDEVLRANRDSDILRLVGDPLSGDPPSIYHGLLSRVEHLVRSPDSRIAVSSHPIPFSISLPVDYLRSVSPSLQFRVVRVHVSLFHPNSRAGMVCLGPRFRPGTRLRALLEHVHGILSSRIFATDHPLDLEAADYYRRHRDRVQGLRAQPLWRRPVAARVRVGEIAAGTGAAVP